VSRGGKRVDQYVVSKIRALAVVGASTRSLPEARFDMPDSTSSFIAATGEGEVRAVPDRATVLVSVRATSGASTDDAGRKATPLERGVLDALDRLGVLREQTSTAAYDAGRERRYVDGGYQDGEYYTEHILSIELHDVERVGRVIEAVRGAGATRIAGVHFWLSDEEAHRERAMRLAIAQAHARARAMAAASSVALGPVVRLGEPDALAAILGPGGVGGGPGRMVMDSVPPGGEGNSEFVPIILPIPIVIRVTIHGAWAIEP